MGAKLSFPITNLNNKVAIVTGANTGIGFETAKALYAMGGHIILACRSEERAQKAMQRIISEVAEEQIMTEGTLEFMKCDLASLKSTKSFIETFKSKDLPLHILINNAGIALARKGYTEDGHESHFQVNHLSHFLITLELLPILRQSTPDARVVFVSSDAHRNGVFDMANIEGNHSYGRMKFYGTSKLYNIMATNALQRRLRGTGITVSSLHPGVVSTEITRSSEDMFIIKLLMQIDSKVIRLGRTPKVGAMTTLNAAVNPELNREDGAYYENCKPVIASSLARNEEKQEELWHICCEMLMPYLSPDILHEYGPLGLREASKSPLTARSLPEILENPDIHAINSTQVHFLDSGVSSCSEFSSSCQSLH